MASSLGKQVMIPAALREKFSKEMRIIVPGELAGLWPIDPGLLKNPEFLNSLLKDKTFTANFEIAIVTKAKA